MDLMFQPLRKYVDFKGRARRAEYWWFFLFTLVIWVVAMVADYALFGDQGPIYLLAVLALLAPLLAVTARRLHDIDRTAWWLLISLIPIVGVVVLLVFNVIRGTAGPNRFGPDPIVGEVADAAVA